MNDRTEPLEQDQVGDVAQWRSARKRTEAQIEPEHHAHTDEILQGHMAELGQLDPADLRTRQPDLPAHVGQAQIEPHPRPPEIASDFDAHPFARHPDARSVPPSGGI